MLSTSYNGIAWVWGVGHAWHAHEIRSPKKGNSGIYVILRILMDMKVPVMSHKVFITFKFDIKNFGADNLPCTVKIS